MRHPALPAEISPDVWRACGGPSARAPHVGSLVYYFPEGHFESIPSFAASDHPLPYLSRPFFLCTVLSVHLLADHDSDEVFAVISLGPTDGSHSFTSSPQQLTRNPIGPTESFSKVLTQSDANNGGGFSVPRSCADTIFPPLDLTADPPVQNLLMRDVHGKVFEFRHIYRGTPRRHLLTTGWARFVNEKKLVAGDTAVFIKNRRDLFIGVRRGPRYMRGHVAAEEVLSSIESASNGRIFEVVYYPRAGEGGLEFVVDKERVERSMTAGYWSTGLRVKMPVETVDSVRTLNYQGTISEIRSKPPPWTTSPWRALQVTWDDPEALKLVRHVNPWQLEINQPIPPPLHSIQSPNYTTNNNINNNNYNNNNNHNNNNYVSPPPSKRARTSTAPIDHFTPHTNNDHFTPHTNIDHFTPHTNIDHFTPRTNIDHFTPHSNNDHFTPHTNNDHFTPHSNSDHFTPCTAPIDHFTPCSSSIQGARQSEYHLPLVHRTPGPPYTPFIIPDLEGSETGTEHSRNSNSGAKMTGSLMLFGKLIEFAHSDDSSEGFNKESNNGDEIFLPGFNEGKMDPGHTRYFTDLVLQSEGI